MSTINRATRSCELEELDAGLKTAMRAHVAQYNLGVTESDILMCCETTSTSHKRGIFGISKETTLSAAYVTPKWLVWADSTNQNDAGTGSAQLKQIDAHDYEMTAMFEISRDHGINVTGRYTDANKTGRTFIVLGSDRDGKKFRELLDRTMKRAKGQ